MKREIRLLRYVPDESDPDACDEDGDPIWFYNFAEVFFDPEGPKRFKEFPLTLLTATGEKKALLYLIQELKVAMRKPPITFYRQEGLFEDKDDG